MAATSQPRQSSSSFDVAPLAEVRERTLAKHPLLGGLLVGLSAEYRQMEAGRRWVAEGKALVADTLAKRTRPGLQVLHDVRLPEIGSLIDHVVVAPSGVWVVAVHRYRGRVEVCKPLFGSAALRVAGRDKTSLSHGLARQVEIVDAAVAEHLPGTAVRGVLCFVDAELPLLGNLTISGQPVLTRKALGRRVTGKGPLAPAEARALVAVLGRRFEVTGADVANAARGTQRMHAA